MASVNIRKYLMILRDGGITIIGIIAVVAFAGWITFKITKQADHPVEEMAETIIENHLEDLLGLDDDALDGIIDLSPGSDEPA